MVPHSGDPRPSSSTNPECLGLGDFFLGRGKKARETFQPIFWLKARQLQSVSKSGSFRPVLKNYREERIEGITHTLSQV